MPPSRTPSLRALSGYSNSVGREQFSKMSIVGITNRSWCSVVQDPSRTPTQPRMDPNKTPTQPNMGSMRPMGELRQTARPSYTPSAAAASRQSQYNGSIASQHYLAPRHKVVDRVLSAGRPGGIRSTAPGKGEDARGKYQYQRSFYKPGLIVRAALHVSRFAPRSPMDGW